MASLMRSPSIRTIDDGAFRRRFARVRELGRGSFGSVFLAEDRDGRDAAAAAGPSGRDLVAVKEVLLPGPGDEELGRDRKGVSQQQRAEEEVRVLRRISGHVNIVSVFESFLVDGRGGAGPDEDAAAGALAGGTLPSGGDGACAYGGPRSLFIVQEFCDGGDLSQFLARHEAGAPLHQDVVVGVLAQLLSGLRHIHAQRILHRDLKSSNVMLMQRAVRVGGDGAAVPIVKLGDFGISKVLTTSALDASTMVGTPYYLSPELCRGQRYNDRSDIWALGCILYELVTLRRCFDGNCLPALVMKIVKGRWSCPDGVFRGPDAGAGGGGSYSASIRTSLLVPMLKPEPSMRPSAARLLQAKVVQRFIAALGRDPPPPPAQSPAPEDQLRASLAAHLREEGGEHASRARPAQQQHRRPDAAGPPEGREARRKADAKHRMDARRSKSREEELALQQARRLNAKVSRATARVSAQERNDAFFVQHRAGADAERRDGIVILEKRAPAGRGEAPPAAPEGAAGPAAAPEGEPEGDAFCEIYVDGVGRVDGEAQREAEERERVRELESMKRRAIEAIGPKLYVHIRRYLLTVINSDSGGSGADDSDVVQSTLLGLLGEENMHVAWLIHRTLL